MAKHIIVAQEQGHCSQKMHLHPRIASLLLSEQLPQLTVRVLNLPPGAESVAHQPSSSGERAADQQQETDGTSTPVPEIVKVQTFACST